MGHQRRKVDAEKDDEFDEFPGLSPAVAKILALKPNDPIDSLVILIERDAPLAFKVLALCNSPALGLRCEISSVSDAVVGLGLRATRSLVLCTSLVEAVGSSSAGALLEIHRGTLRRAATARSLARRSGVISPQEGFTAGLLADVGRFWLAKRHPDCQETLAKLVGSGEDPVKVERELMGEDHVHLGQRIADKWGLPGPLRAIIQRHHDESACEEPVQRVAHLADLAATIQECVVAPDGAEERLSELCHTWFGMERKAVPAWLEEAEKTASEASQTLSLPAPSPTGFDLSGMCQEIGRIYVDRERVVGELRGAIRQAEDYARQLREKVALLDEAATTDHLTGLANRRAISERLERELRTATPEKPTAILLIDLDRFKQINDTFGHDGGDVALKSLATFLKNVTRGGDLVGRYGGDEFIVFLPGSNAKGAQIVAERIRRVIASTAVKLPDGKSLHMEVSIGGCTLPVNENAGLDAIALVDRALYAAKRLGRNKVVWVDGRSTAKAA